MAKESGKAAVKTRFPPSPTGPFHMGNARTALFNYLFTKKTGGTMVLRIEDTDKERSKPEWEKDIVENLAWLGIQWDEGPIRQSDRTPIYKQYLEKLLEQGRAYYCFCSEEELETQRQYQTSIGQAPRYSGQCRNLTREQTQENIEKKMPSVIRFVMESKTATFNDLIRGQVTFDTALIGDIVIAKDLSTPLYNFSVVIDDAQMNITHVIRGEDHLSNTPKQIILQEALGLKKPIYAHLPLILAKDRTKLSKRHGDNSVTRFREEGYLPEAILNFLALLGWNPGTDKEIFSLPQLIDEFSLERIQKGGAVFNIQRLDWINGFYIRQKSTEEITTLCIPYLVGANLITPLWEDKIDNFDPFSWYWRQRKVVQENFRIDETKEVVSFKKIAEIVSLYQERLKKLSEIVELTDFFFRKELEYPTELLYWKDATAQQTKENLAKLETIVSAVGEGEWAKGKLEQEIMPEAEKEKNRGYMLWPFRVALCGKKASAGPFEIAEILGKQKTFQRIQEAKNKL